MYLIDIYKRMTTLNSCYSDGRRCYSDGRRCDSDGVPFKYSLKRVFEGDQTIGVFCVIIGRDGSRSHDIAIQSEMCDNNIKCYYLKSMGIDINFDMIESYTVQRYIYAYA